jgi:drug/metabolite transporter (DMT)-like permease
VRRTEDEPGARGPCGRRPASEPSILADRNAAANPAPHRAKNIGPTRFNPNRRAGFRRRGTRGGEIDARRPWKFARGFPKLGGLQDTLLAPAAPASHADFNPLPNGEAVIAHRTALVKALAAIAIFGTVPSSIRVVGHDASPVGVTVALGIVRLTLATLGMTAMLGSRRTERAALAPAIRSAWPGLAAMGVFFGLHWLTYFLANRLGSPSMSEMGFSTFGAQLPLLGWACGFGRPRAATSIGVALALLGTWLSLQGAQLATGHAASLLVGVLSGALYAALPLLHQRFADVGAQVRTWAQFAFALPVFLALAPLAEWSFSGRDMLLVLHLSLVVTLVGHYLWVQATTVLPIQVTSVVSYLQLPTSLAMNYLFIREPLTPSMLAGAACIVVANLLTLGLRGTRSPHQQGVSRVDPVCRDDARR